MSYYDKPDSCKDCPYFYNTYVPPNEDDLHKGANIVFVGEAPGRHEQEQGEYFVGESGQVLDDIFDDSNIYREHVALLNVIRCDPGGYSNVLYNQLAVEMCSKLLWKDIQTINPKIIVPMGNLPLQVILNKRGISKARGRVTKLPTGVQVVPTFHPAYVLRRPAYKDLVVADMEVIRKVEVDIQIGSDYASDYRRFYSNQEVYDFFEEAHQKGYYALDTETTSLDYREADVICMSFSHTPYTGRALMVDEFDDDIFMSLYANLTRHPKTKVYMQNGKFDLRILNEFFKRRLGSKWTINPKRIRWIDTQNMAALINENLPTNLKDRARLNTDIVYDTDELEMISKGQIQKMPRHQLISYACRDADATVRLGVKFEKELREEDMFHLMVGHPYSDMPVLKALYDMELFGAPLSTEKMSQMENLIEAKLNHFYTQMKSIVGKEFNPNSVPQVKEVLFTDLQLPLTSVRTKTGQPSTDKHAIDELCLLTDNQFPRHLKLYREYATILGTFIKGAEKRKDDEDRLHPHFQSARTVSGRIVCVNPNLANIPRGKEFEEGVLLAIRGLYVARPGWKILYGDWKQIEFKCAALLSGDEKLIHALFVEGQDFHTLTAAALFPDFTPTKAKLAQAQGAITDRAIKPAESQRLREQIQRWDMLTKDLRNNAKVYNFGQLYGGSDEGLAVLLDISVDDVRLLTARRKEAYPQLSRFIEYVPKIAVQQGYLQTPYGRKRRFPYTPSEWVRNSQGRQGINVLPQCHVVGTKVLLPDLTWVNIENLHVGDELVGFDEQTKDRYYRQHWKKSVVTYAERAVAPCFKVELENGESVITTGSHWHLTSNRHGYKNWTQTNKLYFGQNGQFSRLVKTMRVCEHGKTWEHGYIAGMFDADGCFSTYLDDRGHEEAPLRRHRSMSLAQMDNRALQTVEKILEKFGFRFSLTHNSNKPDHWSAIWILNILGGQSEALRFLQTFRPKRLMDVFNINQFGRLSQLEIPRVLAVSYVGKQEIIRLKTDSKTYVADGYATHNSSAAYVGRAALVQICERSRRKHMQGFPFNVVYDCVLGEYRDEEVYDAIAIMTEEMTRHVPELEDRSFSIDMGVGQTWEEAEKNALTIMNPIIDRESIDSAMPYLKRIIRK